MEEMVKSLSSMGGLGILAAALLYLHITALKTFREELAEERKGFLERNKAVVDALSVQTRFSPSASTRSPKRSGRSSDATTRGRACPLASAHYARGGLSSNSAITTAARIFLRNILGESIRSRNTHRRTYRLTNRAVGACSSIRANVRMSVPLLAATSAPSP
jgi:hypothetical protein